jgi:hypothetical protein
VTSLGALRAARVNLEVDLIARYVGGSSRAEIEATDGS